MGSYLVIGGNGRTGRHVVELLVAGGHSVTVASRRPSAVSPEVATVRVDLAEGVDAGLVTSSDGVVVVVEPPVDARGSDALMNRGVARLAEVAAKAGVPVVLVSQIYITRADEHPDMAGIIRARAAGEDALRASGAPYAIVRPSWLTNGPARGVLLEQGDTGDGQISRASVARVTVAALLSEAARGRTFELYDAPGEAPADWDAAFAALTPDA